MDGKRAYETQSVLCLRLERKERNVERWAKGRATDRPASAARLQVAANSTFDPLANPIVNVTVEGLRSATSYDFQFVACFGGAYEYERATSTFSECYYQQPQQARTKGESARDLLGAAARGVRVRFARAAGAPAPPENVSLGHDAESWYVKWRKPADNGGLPLTLYAIDFR